MKIIFDTMSDEWFDEPNYNGTGAKVGFKSEKVENILFDIVQRIKVGDVAGDIIDDNGCKSGAWLIDRYLRDEIMWDDFYNNNLGMKIQ